MSRLDRLFSFICSSGRNPKRQSLLFALFLLLNQILFLAAKDIILGGTAFNDRHRSAAVEELGPYYSFHQRVYTTNLLRFVCQITSCGTFRERIWTGALRTPTGKRVTWFLLPVPK